MTLIAGAGGVGKTALAVQWAHQHLEDYPDGQLYVNLRVGLPAAMATAPRIPLIDHAGLLRSVVCNWNESMILFLYPSRRQAMPGGQVVAEGQPDCGPHHPR